ncbi:hypothetical protein UFOVP223_35 [uncultured Caudovirales phage]|uniref:Uncharacterized protein n=1 Tax=uncultured Caudovirales phage TaxID=2100421 RepID=A0A6J7WVC0_9CAUD|nr:hypothetical protein UFOVP110_129 [uncultured Caudovirales phage]CAB5219173.1 hypothetical protein UFOVP223_35 [uncultured Caudovirales phage]
MFTLHNITKVLAGGDQGNYLVTSHPCPSCNSTITITIEPQKLWVYNQGGYAQDVLEGFTMDTIEMFISGYCGTCWEELFPDEAQG